MADSGPHSDYLAVLRALKDLQSRDGSGEPKKFKTIPETFNVQHPNDEDLDLVYDLRKELQLPRMRALMTKHLKRLQDYVAKENPTSQDIVQLNDYQKQFAQQIKDCVIKTGIPRRYLDNLQGRIAQLHQDIDRASTQEEKDRLKQQGSGSFILRMGTNEQRKYESDIKAYAPEGDAAYQLNKNRDVSELAQIIGAPLLILGKIEETTAGGRIFPLEGDPQTYPNTPSGRPAVEGHLRNPSVLKIYRQDFGRSGVILSDPPPSPPPETGN
jgi:flagellar biosynthesis chaperone FliJ